MDYISENFDNRFSVSLNTISRLGGKNDDKLSELTPEIVAYIDLQLLEHMKKKIDAGAVFSGF